MGPQELTHRDLCGWVRKCHNMGVSLHIGVGTAIPATHWLHDIEEIAHSCLGAAAHFNEQEPLSR